MFGRKCTNCDTKVGGLFGKKNSGTSERLLCQTCSQKEKHKKEQHIKEQRDKEQQDKLQRGDMIMDIEGNVYNTVKIGNQVWTVENLRTTKYNDGTAIPLETNNVAWNNLTKPGFCWYENDIRFKDKYGAFYNWHAANTKKLAPVGWHIPTDLEWSELEIYLINNGYNWDGTKEGNKIAKSLAAQTDWMIEMGEIIGTVGNDLTKNNKSGFSALPGGCRGKNGGFGGIGGLGYWWSATEENASNAYYRNLAYGRGCDSLCRFGYFKSSGFCVRLVKDVTDASQPNKTGSIIEIINNPEAPKLKGYEKVTDADGNVYTTVKIGNQLWTIENLKTTKFNDGTAIPLITDNSEWDGSNVPGYCWYDNEISNKNKYGALYNWRVVNTGKLSLKGWHVPTDKDWSELEKYLIVNGFNWDGTKEGNKIAKSLSAKTDWSSDKHPGTIGNDLSKNNQINFSALPGGFRTFDGRFIYLNSLACWWSTPAAYVASNVYYRFLSSYYDYLGTDKGDPSCGFSVRLLRNID